MDGRPGNGAESPAESPADALAPLRHRRFRLVFLASLVSLVGDRFTLVALPFAVLDLTGSKTDVGLILAMETLSRALFLLVGGVWADRLQRRLVMVGADLTRAISQAAVAGLIISGHAAILELAVLQFAHGAASAFFDPASTGLVAEVVSPGELQRANAQLSLARSAATVAGPLAAGVLVWAVGPGWAIGLDAVTYLASAGLLLRVGGGRIAEPSAGTGFISDLAGGFREVRSRAWLLTTILASGVFQLAMFGTLYVLGPALAKSSLGGPAAWGMIVGAFGLGIALGGVVALRVHLKHVLRSVFLLVFASLPAVLLLALPAPAWIIAGAMVLAGTAASYGGTVYEVVLQQHIPIGSLSRVVAYDWLASTLLASLGLLAAGPLAAAVGLRGAFLCAAAAIAAAATAGLVTPSVWALRSNVSLREGADVVPSAGA